MCYLENKEFKIIPKNSYEVTRNCAKCGCKTNYINTNNFRVNANGNTIDVWLIYQCKKCKHTFNLSIYKRVNPFEIDKLEYEKFLSNDKELAFKCGINKELFERNKADISESNIEYDIIQSKNEVKNASNIIRIYNEYNLKLRIDKLLSNILNISRREVKNNIKNGTIFSVSNVKLDKVFQGKFLEIILKDEFNIEIA